MTAWPSALLWDVDGTLAETELEGHRLAYNQAFAQLNLPWHWDVPLYQQLLSISGGRERLRDFLGRVEAVPPSPDLLTALQEAKQQHYSALVAGGALQLRPGVKRLMEDAAAAGLRQGIVTTSARAAVQALLQQALPEHERLLQFWVCADAVERKKPDPQAYQLALDQLALPAEQVLAIEDSGNGVASATAAGVAVLVTRSASSSTEPAAAFALALAELNHLGDPGDPCRVKRGLACPEGLITLSYLQQLLSTR